MKPSPAMSKKKKARYIWDYYKLQIFGICLVLYIGGYAAVRALTQKTPVLYTALINVNAGETLQERLTGGFLTHLQNRGEVLPKRPSVQLYTGLYLTADPSAEMHQYTYASRIKILASIDNETLDVILMNREALDAFTEKGYLTDLSTLLDDTCSAFLITGTSPSPDSGDMRTISCALDVSSFACFQEAGFSEPVYLGVTANSPRIDTVQDYINYLR